MFFLLNPRVKCFRRIVFHNGYRLLHNNGAGIHADIHKMDGASGNFGAVVQGLFPAFHTRECRKQGGMNIQDPQGECRQERLFHHAHKAGQYDHIGMICLEKLDIFL